MLEAAQHAFWQGHAERAQNWSQHARHFQASSGAGEDAIFFADYVTVYAELAKAISIKLNADLSKFSNQLTFDKARAISTDLIRCNAVSDPSVPARLMRASLLSFHDRSTAAKEFAEVTASPGPMLKKLAFERGAFNYRSAAQTGGPQVTVRHTIVSTLPTVSDAFILMSMDTVYFRKLVPLLLTEVMSFGDLHFHFTIVAPPEEVAKLEKEWWRLWSELLQFSGGNKDQRNVCFSSVEAEGTHSEKTLSACARYLVAEELMAAYDANVYISDSDMVVQNHPLKLIKVQRHFPVSGVMNPGMTILVPWRRVMGGTLIFVRCQEAFDFLRATRQYILAELHAEPSWYLDQNALLYARELTDDKSWSSISATARVIRSLDLNRMLLSKMK
jgi:hypothetical protein